MAEKHVHKFRRHVYKTGNLVYFCMLPDCTYKIATALALGKRTICHRCGEEFIMNEYAIRLAKPHCEKCHRPKFVEAVEDTKIEIKLVMPEVRQPLELDRSVDDLRNRLTGVVHGNLAAKPDDEGDI